MKRIVIAGAGKIGCLIGLHLAQAGDYQVTMLDRDFHEASSVRVREQKNITCVTIDIADVASVNALLAKTQATAIISCLPYFCNLQIVEYALENNLHYFDLTEDVAVANSIAVLAKNHQKVFMPRCGLAPGFIGLVANHLTKDYSEIKSVKMRVGALPINSNNALQYALTWSTDGLINEYANLCEVLRKGEITQVPSLEGLETIKIDGLTYEAFYTSGGIGNLAQLMQGKVRNMSYKTIRYPGHCEKMRFLMKDMQLQEDRTTLKQILERVIPATYQDVVIIYVAITGKQQDFLVESNYVNKIYPEKLYGFPWSAMQVTTASSMAAVVDIVLHDSQNYHGFSCQEKIPFETFITNRFGKIFQSESY